jgi:hypothetical protein
VELVSQFPDGAGEETRESISYEEEGIQGGKNKTIRRGDMDDGESIFGSCCLFDV